MLKKSVKSDILLIKLKVCRIVIKNYKGEKKYAAVL